MNNQLVSEVRNAVEILTQANEEYKNQLDSLSRIDSLRRQKAEASKSSKMLLVGEWLLCYVAVGLILMPSMQTKGLYISMISAFFLRIPLHRFIRKRQEKKDNYEARIEKQQQILEQHRNKTVEILNTHLQELSVIPEIYFQKYKVDQLVVIANMLYEILAYGRADSKKEALNVLENDLHNMRMEAGQQELLSSNSVIQQNSEYAAFQAKRAADYIAWQNFWGNN